MTCNVPGCDEPLGPYGVWCARHYRGLYAVAEDDGR